MYLINIYIYQEIAQFYCKLLLKLLIVEYCYEIYEKKKSKPNGINVRQRIFYKPNLI